MKNQKGFTLIELMVCIIIVATIVATIAVLVVSATVVVKGLNQISDKGLKSVIEEVWEGKSKE